MTRTLTAAAAAALATFATFAAMPSAHAATTAVKVSDLDLATAEGQAKLDERLDSAARRVCKGTITGSRIAKVDSECTAKARASLEQQVAALRTSSRNGG